MISLWAFGLLRRRLGRMIGCATGISLTVAMLATLACFLASSSATLTARAVSGVPVDWQVELVPGTELQALSRALSASTRIRHIETVGYADTAGLESRTGDTVQTTGPGKVLGIGPSYFELFPGQVRVLAGAATGVLIGQQTAANLHAGLNDEVAIQRIGLSPVSVRVAGIIELPNADSLFQAIGVPAGAAPQAPPDNVLIMPVAMWHRFFDEQAARSMPSVRLQLHVGLDHAGLPSDPNDAYRQITGAANHFGAQVVGSGAIANNLGARLDAARGDALYADVLFLFLGVPGATAAAILTLGIARSGQSRRRAEQALLRIRGASRGQVIRLATVEAIISGAIGLTGGALLTLLCLRLLPDLDAIRLSLPWVALAGLIGLTLALAAVALPAWRDAGSLAVATARMDMLRGADPIWMRAGMDLFCLAAAGGLLWQSAGAGYQVVLAPEGVAATAVDYKAFIAPFLLWIGSGLLGWRLSLLALTARTPTLAGMLKPLARQLSPIVAIALSRQRRRIASAVVLVAMAGSFAASTAIFNSTYNAQALIDALLTNGSDLTVTAPPGASTTGLIDVLRSVPGISAVQPMQHRFAYVGNDLQDLYGIDPERIGEATLLSDAYFANGNAESTMSLLKSTHEGVLVSEETVADFELVLGDQIQLRLQGTDHRYHAVGFRFIGVVREFPTAPRDSFLVANAAYVAEMTGSDASEIALIRTSNLTPDLVAKVTSVAATLPGIRVSALGEIRQIIGSSLTSINLRGLTQIELAFAYFLISGTTGLAIVLSIVERRRSYAILAALGAKRAQLAAFLWSEAIAILAGGLLLGIMVGYVLARVLVALLTGVFDPPPDVLSIPWIYLATLVTAAVLSAVVAVRLGIRHAMRSVSEDMRGL